MKIKFKKGDIIVFAVVVLFIAVICIVTFPKNGGNTVEISVDGNTLTFPLDKDTTFETSGAFKNIITVKDKSVWVSYAGCPDKVCKNTGKISKKGQSIICVPEKMIVKITGGGEIDAVAN